MVPGEKKSVEQIKQEIDFYKENLKFLNSFYLPIGTGLVVIFFSNNPIPYRTGWVLTGLFSLGFLTLLKRDLLKDISKLIKEL